VNAKRPTVPAPPAPGNQPAQQHDLEPALARRLVTVAQVKAGERVLEIGPGTGALTAALLAGGAQVAAVERDPVRLAQLQRDFPAEITSGQLQLHGADASRWQPRMAPPWRVLANPPFNLTARLLGDWWLAGERGPWRLDLLLQRESAEKLCAAPGALSRSAVLAQFLGQPSIRLGLPRHAVQPPSRVDLVWWTWQRRLELHPPAALERFARLLERGFAGTHTMAEALRGLATGPMLRRQASQHAWKLDAHPRTLSPAAWWALADIMGRCGKL